MSDFDQMARRAAPPGVMLRAIANTIHDFGWPVRSPDRLALAAKLIGCGFSARDVDTHLEAAINLVRVMEGHHE